MIAHIKNLRGQPLAAAAVAIALGATATILGAWFFEYVLGYIPCPLCLQQRIAYYIAIPLAARIVRCDEAAWRFLGLSLAGYNVLISLALAGIAAFGARAAMRN